MTVKIKFVLVMVFLLSMLVSFVGGIIYGYSKGVYNHVVFDAPNRTKVYNHGMTSDVAKEVVFSNLISSQKWAARDFESKTSKVLFYVLPVHRTLSEQYEEGRGFAEKVWSADNAAELWAAEKNLGNKEN